MDNTPERDKFPTTWESGQEIKEAPQMDLHCPLIKGIGAAYLNSTSERCAMRREIGGGCYMNPCGAKKTIRVAKVNVKKGKTTCTKQGCKNEHVAKGLCRKHYNAKLQSEKEKLYVSRMPLRKLRNRLGDLDTAELNKVTKYVEKLIKKRALIVLPEEVKNVS